jgi:hypothetical protein
VTRRVRCGRERGATAVEFALIAPILFTLLFAILGFGHLLYTMEAVSDATRTGARIAVVCDLNTAGIRQSIQARLPHLSLTNAQISLQYLPAGCDRTSCQSVQVSLSGVSYSPWTWLLPAQFPMPPFTTTLPRESLESVNAAGESNPVCT